MSTDLRSLEIRIAFLEAVITDISKKIKLADSRTFGDWLGRAVVFPEGTHKILDRIVKNKNTISYPYLDDRKEFEDLPKLNEEDC